MVRFVVGSAVQRSNNANAEKRRWKRVSAAGPFQTPSRKGSRKELNTTALLPSAYHQISDHRASKCLGGSFANVTQSRSRKRMSKGPNAE